MQSFQAGTILHSLGVALFVVKLCSQYLKCHRCGL